LPATAGGGGPGSPSGCGPRWATRPTPWPTATRPGTPASAGAYVEGTLEDLAGSYTLEPAGDGTTRVTYRLDVALGMPLPGLVRRQAARQIVRSALDDLKRRVESM
jgi:hypothetical protein